MKDELIRTEDLGELLGLNRGNVGVWRDKKVLIQHSKGFYYRDENVKRWIKHLREIGAKSEEKKSLEEEKLRKTTAEANNAEKDFEKKTLLLAALKGDFLEVEISNRIHADFDASIRAKILSIPSTVTPKLEGLTKFKDIQSTLTNSIDEILKEFSSNDEAERRRTIIREYRKSQRDKLQSSDEAQSQSVGRSE